jgi:murein L,D-transpeptidase YafK
LPPGEPFDTSQRLSRWQPLLFAVTALLASHSAAQALPHVQADRIVVHKAERTLTLYWHDAKLKTYRVALGAQPLGPKTALGDGRTPEGRYTVTRRKARSDFHGALKISYPSPDDLARARAAGRAPGGGIEIHGLHDGFEWLGSAHAILDWTDGCIAVTNTEIDELLRAVPDGTPLEILP